MDNALEQRPVGPHPCQDAQAQGGTEQMASEVIGRLQPCYRALRLPGTNTLPEECLWRTSDAAGESSCEGSRNLDLLMVWCSHD
jgi:hypothetical protein